MKVLYSVSCKDALNPFLETLSKAIKVENQDIKFGFNSFSIWDDSVYNYDILHIMWPEFLINDDHSSIELKHRLIEIKSKGVHIVSTCHNLAPHYCCNQEKHKAVRYAYELSEIIHHMGQWSLEYLKKQYPNVRHELIPHHIYDNMYTYFPSKKEACLHLGLSPYNNYILCLGAFRSQEEEELVMYVAKHLKSNMKLIAPSLILDMGNRFDLKKRIKYYRLKYITNHNRLISNIGYINNSELPYFMAISDISLIQRLKILNSGNLTLGMYAGNVIIGPNMGNVGKIINDTDNYTFTKKEDIPGLIDHALTAVKSGKGIRNRKFSMSNWSSSTIAKQVLSSYKTLMA